MPPDTPRHYVEVVIPKDVKNAYSRMINTLFSWRKKAMATPANPCRLPLTPEAKVLFDEYHDELENERAALPSGIMKATLSKLKGYIMRIALTLHVARIASLYPDGKVPRRIPRIDEETMKAAITLTKWYRREAQRILQMVCPNEVLVGDKEVHAILRHLKKHGETTARKVSQYVKPFKGVGGSEKASLKLEDMVTNGLLIHDNQPIKKRVYSQPNTAYADIPPAVPAETADFVGGCRHGVGGFVGGENDAKSNENKGLEKVVGIVGVFGGVDPEEDIVGDEDVVGGAGACETNEDAAECPDEDSDPPEIDERGIRYAYDGDIVVPY
jgi:hypothetical protein